MPSLLAVSMISRKPSSLASFSYEKFFAGVLRCVQPAKPSQAAGSGLDSLVGYIDHASETVNADARIVRME